MRISRSVRILAVFLLVVAGSRAAAADELHLANGDRLTGTVEGLESGTLTFKTAGGELKIAWHDVTSLTTDHPLLVRTGTQPPVLMMVDAVTPDALAAITGIAAPTPPVVWRGGADLGILNARGNTRTSSLRVDGDITARTAHDRYASSAIVNRASDRGVETARNWTSSFDYNRFVSRRLFVSGSLILTNDPFRDLDLRTAVSVGLGYQIWETPRDTLSVTAGFGHVRENFATAPDDRFSALQESTKLDVSLFSGDRVHAFHHHDGYFGPSDDGKLFFRMQNGVRIALVGGLASTAEFDLDYDRHPSIGRVPTDRSVSVTFGYRFP
jgi:putative salt-induced outer membrane protein YdiY